jgi:bifunctional non-homologous end joining protein LigD
MPGSSWLHEIKHDGFRVLASKLGGWARAWSQRGADFADRFPLIAKAVRGLSPDEAPAF